MLRQEKEKMITRKRIDNVRKRYSQSHIMLACHVMSCVSPSIPCNACVLMCPAVRLLTRKPLHE